MIYFCWILLRCLKMTCKLLISCFMIPLMILEWPLKILFGEK